MAKKNGYENSNILEPLDFAKIGSSSDPCFGKSYDLTTEECRLCGDSELCCAVFAANLGKTRDKLEKENKYKDLEVLIDKTSVFKYIKASKKKGLTKKDILAGVRDKFEVTKEESRMLYRESLNKSK